MPVHRLSLPHSPQAPCWTWDHVSILDFVYVQGTCSRLLRFPLPSLFPLFSEFCFPSLSMCTLGPVSQGLFSQNQETFHFKGLYKNIIIFCCILHLHSTMYISSFFDLLFRLWSLENKFVFGLCMNHCMFDGVGDMEFVSNCHSCFSTEKLEELMMKAMEDGCLTQCTIFEALVWRA